MIFVLGMFSCYVYWVRLIFFISKFRLPDEFNDPNFSTVTIQRDLFYGYDTLMENVSDPSHINFAHHKVRSSGRIENKKNV